MASHPPKGFYAVGQRKRVLVTATEDGLVYKPMQKNGRRGCYVCLHEAGYKRVDDALKHLVCESDTLETLQQRFAEEWQKKLATFEQEGDAVSEQGKRTRTGTAAADDEDEGSWPKLLKHPDGSHSPTALKLASPAQHSPQHAAVPYGTPDRAGASPGQRMRRYKVHCDPRCRSAAVAGGAASPQQGPASVQVLPAGGGRQMMNSRLESGLWALMSESAKSID